MKVFEDKTEIRHGSCAFRSTGNIPKLGNQCALFGESKKSASKQTNFDQVSFACYLKLWTLIGLVDFGRYVELSAKIYHITFQLNFHELSWWEPEAEKPSQKQMTPGVNYVVPSRAGGRGDT